MIFAAFLLAALTSLVTADIIRIAVRLEGEEEVLGYASRYSKENDGSYFFVGALGEAQEFIMENDELYIDATKKGYTYDLDGYLSYGNAWGPTKYVFDKDDNLQTCNQYYACYFTQKVPEEKLIIYAEKRPNRACKKITLHREIIAEDIKLEAIRPGSGESLGFLTGLRGESNYDFLALTDTGHVFELRDHVVSRANADNTTSLLGWEANYFSLKRENAFPFWVTFDELDMMMTSLHFWACPGASEKGSKVLSFYIMMRGEPVNLMCVNVRIRVNRVSGNTELSKKKDANKCWII